MTLEGRPSGFRYSALAGLQDSVGREPRVTFADSLAGLRDFGPLVLRASGLQAREPECAAAGVRLKLA